MTLDIVRARAHTTHMNTTPAAAPDLDRMNPDHDPMGRGCALAGRAAAGHDVAPFDICRPCYLEATGTSPVAPPVVVEPDLDRDEAIARIRKALRERTGRSWSVTGGRGTSWGWIRIHALPARREEYGYMTGDDQATLARALGLTRIHPQGESIPAGHDYRVEYVDRAEGREPRRVGRPYWD